MNEDVAKLTDLYLEGSKSDKYFNSRLEAIIGDKFEAGNSRETDATDDLLQELKTLKSDIDEYVSGWIQSVTDLLRTEEIIEFNNPMPNSDINMNLAFKYLPEDAVDAREFIDRLYSHNKVLKKILKNRPSDKSGATSTREDIIEPAKYDSKLRAIIFAGAVIKFRDKSEFRPELCKTIFNEPDKVFTLDSLEVVWDHLADFMEKEDRSWQKIYDAVKEINERVNRKTSISDLFILSTTSVQLNPKYK